MKKILVIFFAMLAGSAYGQEAQNAKLVDSCADINNAKLVKSLPIIKGTPQNPYQNTSVAKYQAADYAVHYYIAYIRIQLKWSQLNELRSSGKLAELERNGTLIDTDTGAPMIKNHNFEISGAKLITTNETLDGRSVSYNKNTVHSGFWLGKTHLCRIVNIQNGSNIIQLGFQVTDNSTDIYEFR